MSDTPRTQAIRYNLMGFSPEGKIYALFKWSEQIERELNTVTDQRDAITLRLGRTQEKMFDAEKQRDRLEEALRECLPFITGDGCGEYSDARDALQSLTPKDHE